MDLKQLRYFIAVAEELHFGRAAARLFISQPALSFDIKKLEEQLGIQLLVRNNKSVKLTNAGQVLLDEARSLLLQAEKVKRLNEIKAGDKIKVEYFESMALSLEPPGAGGETGMKSKTMTERQSGKLPGGTIAHQESGTVEIVKIDKDKNQLTVKRPNGEMDVINVKSPELQSHLDQLKEGDKVKASYTEAAVISIERPSQNQQGMTEKSKENTQGMNEKSDQNQGQQPNKSM